MNEIAAPDILVINAGSSSLKFSVYRPGPGALDSAISLPLLDGQIERVTTDPFFTGSLGVEGLQEKTALGREKAGHEACLAFLLAWLADKVTIGAAGHRVVHGGTRFVGPVRVTPEVLTALRELAPLAPLHQPHNLAAIETLERLFPGLPQVACFDTAFHATKPLVASVFPLPREMAAGGIRRYGFHGLSYEHIARVLPSVAPTIADKRVVVLHLGSGASVCAMKEGRSVESSMGFTAVDGLPMGTRCGAIDPGVVLYLIRERGMSPNEVEYLLYNRSGLKGVSGIASDMRELLASDHPHAKEAVDIFIYGIIRQIGAMAASLGGLDGLVFTAGIGERSVEIRDRVCRAVAWLGVQLDPAANQSGGPRISTEESPISVWVIPTDEEGMIARHTLALLSPSMDEPPCLLERASTVGRE